ncbi:MAG: aldolase/citrate lyase family protein [Planctomycetaceae bacterium]
MSDGWQELIPTQALRAKLSRGEPCLGAWLSIGDPLTVETWASDCTLDWVLIDMEHSGQGWQGLQMMFLGWKGCATPLIVRVPSQDLSFISRAMDLGAAGIVVPFVNTAEQAARIVSACKYPPVGTRGFGPRRASRHYARSAEYRDSANDGLFVVVQIEHRQGLENVEEIASVPGLDGLFIGPGDLSFSLGVPQQYTHPDLLAAIRRIIQVGKAKGLPLSMAIDDRPEIIANWIREGIAMPTIGLDGLVLREAFKQAAMAVRNLASDSKTQA